MLIRMQKKNPTTTKKKHFTKKKKKETERNQIKKENVKFNMKDKLLFSFKNT
jgi:hypothetical protein